MESRRHYEVLCIANFSSAEEVRLAYKSLALKYHPDKNLGDLTAAERFRAVSRAYEVLSNEETKRKYDAALRASLSSYGQRTGVNSGGDGSVNPYSMQTPSMSDIYRELYQRQAARASTRNRTSSAPPQGGKASASQYTKAQQEHFRKRERERQQELRRQREKERKEQRDREREALRREQERQEELLQQRWRLQQQQQKAHPMRGSTGNTTAAAAASSSTGTTSDSAAHIDDGHVVSLRMRRGSPRQPTEGGRSGVECHAPNTVLLGAPARLTVLTRNGASTTPRTYRAYSPLSLSPRPATKPRRAEAGAPSVLSPSSGRQEETTDAGAVEGGLSTGSYTSHTSPVKSGGLEEGAARSSTHGSCAGSPVRDEEQAMTQTAGVHRALRTGSAPPSLPASGFAHTTSVDAPPEAFSQPRTRNTQGTSEDFSENGTARGCREDRHITLSSYHPVTRTTALNRGTVRSGSSTTTTPRQWGTPRTFTNLHVAAAAPPTSLRASSRGQPITARCRGTVQTTVSDRSHSSSAGARSTLARTSYTAHKSSNINGVTSRDNPAHASFPQRACPISGIADTDKELLDRRRRERMAKEKERQRSVRLAEEERQFRRLTRAAKHQREKAAAISSAEAAKAQTEEEPLSFGKQLEYLLHDEASERDQLIEREEELAWRRLHHHQAKVLQGVLIRRRLAALATEEATWRNGLLKACKAERARYFLFFHEQLDRLHVEGREGRERRRLIRHETADGYYLRRASQRRKLFGGSTQALFGHSRPAAEAVDDTSALTAQVKAHHSSLYSVHSTAIPLENGHDATTRLASDHLRHQRHSDESTPLAARILSSLDAMGGRGRSTASPPAVVDASATEYLGSFRSASSSPRATSAMPDRLWGGNAFARASERASPCSSPNKHRSVASSNSANRTTTTDTASTNVATRMLLTGAEQLLLTLFSDESRQRGLLVRQQQQGEMELRRRRATSLHRLFEKDKEHAVKHAQRCALVELTALKAQLRMLQSGMRHSSSPRSIEVGFSADATGAASGSPVNSARWRAESSTPSRHGSPLPLPHQAISEANTAASASPLNTARALSVTSILTSTVTLNGWTALPDSDVEED
ncbi:chaperone DNAJ protein, putative [Leishmania tarentolae]|uniref:Chaperone DNAJ protein, putative n=1 Tax=Leishmania tarentolae TaxID=5689 RepID=A0A640KJE0_LEITA|nr:chaperone DNAJ protein, putative [Leishmania tarentolae]